MKQRSVKHVDVGIMDGKIGLRFYYENDDPQVFSFDEKTWSAIVAHGNKIQRDLEYIRQQTEPGDSINVQDSCQVKLRGGE